MAGPDGQTVTFTSASDITLTVEQPEELGSVISRMQALIDNGHPESKALKNAKKFVEKALGNFDPGAAIPDVLKADDKLLGITDEDVIDIRAALGIWIRWAAQLIN